MYCCATARLWNHQNDKKCGLVLVKLQALLYYTERCRVYNGTTQMVSGFSTPWFPFLSMLITQPVYIFYQNCLANDIYIWYVILNILCKFFFILWEVIFFLLPELKFIFKVNQRFTKQFIHFLSYIIDYTRSVYTNWCEIHISCNSRFVVDFNFANKFYTSIGNDFNSSKCALLTLFVIFFSTRHKSTLTTDSERA